MMVEQPKPLTAPLPPHVLAGARLAARPVERALAPTVAAVGRDRANLLAWRGLGFALLPWLAIVPMIIYIAYNDHIPASVGWLFFLFYLISTMFGLVFSSRSLRTHKADEFPVLTLIIGLLAFVANGLVVWASLFMLVYDLAKTHIDWYSELDRSGVSSIVTGLSLLLALLGLLFWSLLPQRKKKQRS